MPSFTFPISLRTRKSTTRSFRASKTRSQELTYSTGPTEMPPGESLAKYSRRPEAEPEHGSEDKNAPLGAVAEEPPAAAARPAAEASGEAPAPVTRSEEKTEHRGKQEQAEHKDEESPSSARITDRSDNYEFAHRSSSRRGRRGRGGPPPAKPEEHRPNGHTPRPNPTISELLREGQEIL